MSARTRKGRETRAVSVGVAVLLAASLVGCSQEKVDEADAGPVVDGPSITVEIPPRSYHEEFSDDAFAEATNQYIYARLLTEQYASTELTEGMDLAPLHESYEDVEQAWGRAQYAAEVAGLLAGEALVAAGGPEDRAGAPLVESEVFPVDQVSLSLEPEAAVRAGRGPRGPVRTNSGADPYAWAEEMAAPYDDAAGAQSIVNLAELMEADAREVARKAQLTNEYIAERRHAEIADMDWWARAAAAVRSAAKIGLNGLGITATVAAMPAMGPAAAALSGIGICVAGADAFLELWKGGANIFLGEDNEVAAGVSEAQDTLSPAGFVVGFPSPGDAAGIVTTVGNLASDYFGDGTVIGFDVSPARASALVGGSVQAADALTEVTMVPIPVGLSEQETNGLIEAAGFNPHASEGDGKSLGDVVTEYEPNWDTLETRLDGLVEVAGTLTSGAGIPELPSKPTQSTDDVVGEYTMTMTYEGQAPSTGTRVFALDGDGGASLTVPGEGSLGIGDYYGTYSADTKTFVGAGGLANEELTLTFDTSTVPITASGGFQEKRPGGVPGVWVTMELVKVD